MKIIYASCDYLRKLKEHLSYTADALFFLDFANKKLVISGDMMWFI